MIHTTWRNSPATRNGKPHVLGMTGPGANPSSFLDLFFFQVPKSETPGRSHRKTEDLVGETVLTSGGEGGKLDLITASVYIYIYIHIYDVNI